MKTSSTLPGRAAALVPSVSLALAVFVAGAGCQSSERAAETAEMSRPTDSVERGEYLVTTMGCNDCHTPWTMGANGPEPDSDRMLSGHPADLRMPPPPEFTPPWGWAGSLTMTAFTGPWGITYGANLTPDMETGLGAWDENLFIAAIRNGKVKGAGRPMLPPMPQPSYQHLTDEDLKAIFAYLKSVPPVKNQVPEWVPPAGGAPGPAAGTH